MMQDKEPVRHFAIGQDPGDTMRGNAAHGPGERKAPIAHVSPRAAGVWPAHLRMTALDLAPKIALMLSCYDVEDAPDIYGGPGRCCPCDLSDVNGALCC